MRWKQAGTPIVVSVNVSALEMRQPDFIGRLNRVLRENDLPAELLELELTESILLQDAQEAAQRLGDDEGDHAIVSAIVYLGRSLHLCVVAEGVETPAQRATLEQMQCDQYQGYLCSPALPASDFARMLAGQGPGTAVTPP